jgi:hypothetical protein
VRRSFFSSLQRPLLNTANPANAAKAKAQVSPTAEKKEATRPPSFALMFFLWCFQGAAEKKRKRGSDVGSRALLYNFWI